MTVAANQLIAAMKEAKTLTGMCIPPLEQFQKGLATFKTKTKAIDLRGCSDEFKDAFAMWEQTVIAKLEAGIMRRDYTSRNRCNVPPIMKSEAELLDQLDKTAEIRFKAVCRKLELNVPFENSVLEVAPIPSDRIIDQLETDFQDFQAFPGTTGDFEFEFDAFPGVTGY